MNPSDINALISTNDPIFARLLKVLLETAGVQNINIAPDAQDIEAASSSKKPVIVFAEWNMDVPSTLPATDFTDTAANDNHHWPLVLVGSEHSLNIVKKARKRGAAGYISAPVGLKSIQAWVAGLVEGIEEIITAPGYLGPERRRDFANLPDIRDRRISSAKVC